MNIIVGLTSRPESHAALDRAVEEAKLRSATLHVVQTLGDGLSENPARNQAWATQTEQVRKEGEALVARLAADGVVAHFRIEPIARDAASTLLRVARELDAGLLVIGLRRRSPVGKLVLGSVSQDILLHAECPVLAIKMPDR